MELNLFSYGILFIAGILAGFIDAIAGGGGLITVPSLLVVGIPPTMALGTNKLQGSIGSFMAFIRYRMKGLFSIRESLIGIPSTFLGAALGTFLILRINNQILKYIIPFLLLAIFLYTLKNKSFGQEEKEPKLKKGVFYLSFGLILGFYDGFFGPGTGTFWIIVLITYLGYNFKKASAETKLFNFISNIVSLFVFILGGQVLWFIGLLMGVGQIIGTYLGTNFLIVKDVKIIKTIFLTVVFCSILKILYDNIMPLLFN